MLNLQKNTFVVGPQASGESFFGREKEIYELESLIFFGVGAIHLIGPTRIGKSSLVSKVFEKNREYPNRLRIQISMGECSDSYEFWTTLAFKLRNEIYDAALWNKDFQEHYETINIATKHVIKGWFNIFRLSLETILEIIGKAGYRLVLAIDEFDSVIRIFKDEASFFQVLREIYTNPVYATSGVLVSRRRLHLLETECEHISTFHGAFRETPLGAFSYEDMLQYYKNLFFYNINILPEGKEKLQYYTGNIPYLCCMFADRMVIHKKQYIQCGVKEIDRVFKDCLPQIDRYYEDLITRLNADNHTEIIFYLSIDSRLPNITTRDIDNMRAMGILVSEGTEECTQYYVYSQDFMTYFKTRPLKLPAWEIMTSSEKKIKSIFKKEFPELDKITYQELIGENGDVIRNEINRIYPELNLNWKQVIKYCENLSAHKNEPTILDVLTLSKVIGIILQTWNERFYYFFEGNSEWKHKLEQIRKLRNPMAHAQLESIDKDELAVCLKFCEEIIRL